MIRPRKLVPRWFPTSVVRNPRNSLHPPEVMQLLLERERMRSDRGNSSFSLLTLTFSTRCTKRRLLALGRVFRKRTRATDDAGLLGPQCVGVLLPETSADGAWKLAGDLCQLLPAGMPQPLCDVYLYPSPPNNDYPWLSNGHANGEARNGNPSTNGNAAQHSNRRGARAMHALFVRPQPGWKRVIDVLGALVALLLLAPLMLVVATMIKLTSPGPIIFAQQRHTIGGREFKMYKFRTMTENAELEKDKLRPLSEQDGPAFKIARDPRVTTAGRFLRATSIDELPQLFNVLRGEMSLVGPRPLPCDESSRCEAWQRRRLDVVPGLTCTWQVRGRSSVSFAEWMRMDVVYVRDISLGGDLKLLAQTVVAVLARRGAC